MRAGLDWTGVVLFVCLFVVQENLVGLGSVG